MPELIIEARKAAIGPSLEVKRILPFRLKRMVGPFIFMDHAGPIKENSVKASSLDVLPHPHIGLSTVTYLFGGKVTHRDSLGVEQVIVPGEVNWMTAGSGIAHSERFEDPNALASGAEMIQAWVALPERDEETSPAFTNYNEGQLPVFTDKGVWWRLIAGAAFGEKSAVHTHSPLVYMHVKLDKGFSFTMPHGYTERGIYLVSGTLAVDSVSCPAGRLIVFAKNEHPVIHAAEPAVLMVLGGEPLGERHIWWNFVSSRKERIEQAKADWKAGRIRLPPGDNQSFIPLPPDRRSDRDKNVEPEPLS
jgi:redox-sensitive bicupin YhaK (pirin superfamily)